MLQILVNSNGPDEKLNFASYTIQEHQSATEWLCALALDKAESNESIGCMEDGTPLESLNFYNRKTDTIHNIPASIILNATDFEPVAHLGIDRSVLLASLRTGNWEPFFKENRIYSTVSRPTVETNEPLLPEYLTDLLLKDADAGDFESEVLLAAHNVTAVGPNSLKGIFDRIVKREPWSIIDASTIAGYPLPLPEACITLKTEEGTYFYDSFGFFGQLIDGSYEVTRVLWKNKKTEILLIEFFYTHKPKISAVTNWRLPNKKYRHLNPPKGWFSFSYPKGADKYPFHVEVDGLYVPLEATFDGYAKRRGSLLQVIPVGGKAFTSKWEWLVTKKIEATEEFEECFDGRCGYCVPSDFSLTDGGTLEEELAKF